MYRCNSSLVALKFNSVCKVKDQSIDAVEEDLVGTYTGCTGVNFA